MIREALVNHLKMKEKEAANYMNLVGQLKKENSNLKNKLEHKQGFSRIVELEDKLKDTEKRNAELQREVKSM